jgi:hypothetical protein
MYIHWLTLMYHVVLHVHSLINVNVLCGSTGASTRWGTVGPLRSYLQHRSSYDPRSIQHTCARHTVKYKQNLERARKYATEPYPSGAAAWPCTFMSHRQDDWCCLHAHFKVLVSFIAGWRTGRPQTDPVQQTLILTFWHRSFTFKFWHTLYVNCE